MVYEKFKDHHHNDKCPRPECSERLTAYEKLIGEHSSLTDRFNKISTELKDVKEKFESQKIRNSQLSMEKQTLTKKIDDQRKSNKGTHDSYEALRKLYASLEIKHDLMKKKAQSLEKLETVIEELQTKNELLKKRVGSYDKLQVMNNELEIANGLMKKKVESYEKFKAMIKESDFLSE